MNELNTLKNKDPKEVAQVLTVISTALLPSPGVEDAFSQLDKASEVVKSVLNEIRNRLKIRQDDYSKRTQSQIYSFLSAEISKAVLSNTNLNSIKARLGSKGELHPSQYEVRIPEYTRKGMKNLGTRESHVVEAITEPDDLIHIFPKYVSGDKGINITISNKLISSKRSEDKFILIVISRPSGQVQYFRMAYRFYLSENNTNDLNNPLDVLKAFVNTFGLNIRFADKVSNFFENELIEFDQTIKNENDLRDRLTIIDKSKVHHSGGFAFGADTGLTGPNGGRLAEVVLAFGVDLKQYVNELLRHHVKIDPELSVDLPGIM